MGAILPVALSIFTLGTVFPIGPADSAESHSPFPTTRAGDGMSDSWLNQFESALQHLESVVNSDQIDCARVMQAAASAIGKLNTEADIRFWLQSGQSNAGQSSCENNTSTELLWGTPPEDSNTGVIAGLLTNMSDQQLLCTQHDKSIVVRRQLSTAVEFFIEVANGRPVCAQESFEDGIAATAEIACTSVARLLVARYEERLEAQFLLTEFTGSLNSSIDLNAAARSIAHDSPPIFGDCRVSVFQASNARAKLLSVTGVQEVSGQSETLEALNVLTKSAASSEWTDITDDPSQELSPLRQQGIAQVRHIPVPSDSGEPVGHVIIELFQEQAPPEELILRQYCRAVEGTLTRLLNDNQGWHATLLAGGRPKWGVAAAVAVVLLAVVPADFEVEVPGRVTSTNQHRIFAPDNGFVEEVQFENEQHVNQDDLLVELSNADLLLEERRLLGEIDTVRAERTTVRSRLLTEDDPGLSAQSERLTQQLTSLEGQLGLLQERLGDLNLSAPAAGNVYRIDPGQELRNRPVVRGQLLMELVPDDTTWELRLEIPDHLEHYVRAASANSDGVQLRYTLAAAPGREWNSKLTGIDHAVQLNGESMTCRATASIGSLSESHLRPGTSVTARISCGSRSLGFVWFREVIEFANQVRFSWF